MITRNTSSCGRRWSKWHRIADWAQSEFAPNVPGVYRVRATKSPGEPTSIPRACCVDCEGIVYIGEAKSLRGRIGRLSWACDPNAAKHPHHDVISTWLSCDLNRICDLVSLEVCWVGCDDHKAEERLLLAEYKRTYGDIPVANMKAPKLAQDG